MKRKLWIFLWAVGLNGLSHAGELFAAAPLDQVTVRVIPTFTVIETDVTSSLDQAWTKGFRLGARYTALAGSNLNTPTMILFPDWDKNPMADGNQVHLLVQCLLDPLSNLPKVHDRDAHLQNMPSMTVACCAHSGAYTAAHFLSCLKKIQDHLAAQHIPAAGSPRYLYYTDTTWVPNWWRVGEVQVPIAPGVGGN